MENIAEIKNLITQAKNICLIPSESEPESLPAVLALFYTLKDLGKNVNLVIDNFPQTYQFLVPSPEFISQPKNFVVSIPKNVAQISQVYYEKNEESLKIHLTIEKGTIKKDNISFYFTEPKPDVTITVGVAHFQKMLEGKLDSFGFLLDSPIINIDNHPENIKFGKINAVENTSLAQLTLEIISELQPQPIKKEVAHCLLTGLTQYYQNFQSQKVTAQVFELSAQLMKLGADRQQILEYLYGSKAQSMPQEALSQPLST